MTTGAPTQNMPKGPLFLRYATGDKRPRLHPWWASLYAVYRLLARVLKEFKASNFGITIHLQGGGGC
jgi:hypothetical protein